jgi:hypothetical protein
MRIHCFDRNGEGYDDSWVDFAWQGWQARGQAEPLTDERISAIALDVLRRNGDPGANRSLTYDSGPYEITKCRHVVFELARAIEREITTPTVEAGSCPKNDTDFGHSTER